MATRVVMRVDMGQDIPREDAEGTSASVDPPLHGTAAIAVRGRPRLAALSSDHVFRIHHPSNIRGISTRSIDGRNSEGTFRF